MASSCPEPAPPAPAPGRIAGDDSTAANVGDADVLAIVIDMNPLFWARQLREAKDRYSASGGSHQNTITFSTVVDSALALANAHMLSNRANAIAVYGSLGNRGFLLYGTEPEPAKWTQAFSGMDDAVNEGIRTASAAIPDDPKEIMGQNRGIVACLATAACRLSRIIKTVASPRMHGRILVLCASEDPTDIYIPFMNSVFAAKNLGVVIDACVVAPGRRTELLKQACAITGGTHEEHLGGNAAGLAQVLLFVFSAGSAARKHLPPPRGSTASMSATCLATYKPISIGLVCSSCLSTFAEWHTRCPVCGVEFDRDRRAAAEHAVSTAKAAKQEGWSTV